MPEKPVRWNITRRRRYLRLVAIAAAGQATGLILLSVLQFAVHSVAEGRPTAPGLDQLVKILSVPLLIFYPPEWSFWLRQVLNDRLTVLLFVAMNAFIWGVALAGGVDWWQHSSLRGRSLGLIVVLGVVGLVVFVAQTRTIYCHGNFSGILHCHFFVTSDHDH